MSKAGVGVGGESAGEVGMEGVAGGLSVMTMFFWKEEKGLLYEGRHIGVLFKQNSEKVSPI